MSLCSQAEHWLWIQAALGKRSHSSLQQNGLPISSGGALQGVTGEEVSVTILKARGWLPSLPGLLTLQPLSEHTSNRSLSSALSLPTVRVPACPYLSTSNRTPKFSPGHC